MLATLLDLNECEGPSPCDGNAQCTNTIGSFSCDCNEGYSGDGMTCTGLNFNAEDANLCLCIEIIMLDSTPACRSTVVVKLLHSCYSARY